MYSFLSDFYEIWAFSTDCQKKILAYLKSSPVAVVLFRADRRTCIVEFNSLFSQICQSA